MTKNYTTKTASLRATNIDTRNLDAKKISLDGKNVLDYINESETIIKDGREIITENDLWGTVVKKDDKGNVIVEHNEVKLLENVDETLYAQITRIEDNKAYIDDDFYCNIQTSMIKDGEKVFAPFQNLKTFKSDLSSLSNTKYAFSKNTLESFESDIFTITNTSNMFEYASKLSSFKGKLSNIINGEYMFASCSSLKDITDGPNNGYLSSLVNGDHMFFESGLECNEDVNPFGRLNSLENAAHMFSCAKSLTNFYTEYSPVLTYIEAMFNECENIETVVMDASNVVNGRNAFMFCHKLKNISLVSLSKLVDGKSMFEECNNLERFDYKLHSLKNGNRMFLFCEKLSTFDVDCLKSLLNGELMMAYTPIKDFNYDLPSLEYGAQMFKNCASLKSFTGALPSLISGFEMFKGCKLDKESILLIADGIKNLEDSGHAIRNGNSWTYSEDEEMWRYKTDLFEICIVEKCRGSLHISYDSEGLSESDIAEIYEYFQEIANKGWTLYVSDTDTDFTLINPN